MPGPRKSRQAPITNGMPKSKIEKKGCRNREKAVNSQSQTACQKAKSRKKDAGAEKKSSNPKHKRHAKKQNQEKRMPELRKSRQTPSANGMPKSKIKKKGCRSRKKASKPQAQTACQKAKSRKKDAGTGEKPTILKHKRHAKKQNQEKRMPEPGKSRQSPGTNGMPKSKIKKKGCRSRKKAVKPQAQTACQNK